MSGWETMPGRDRIWLGLNTTVVVSTSAPSGRAVLLERLRALAVADPGCVLFRTAHPDRADGWKAAEGPGDALRALERIEVVDLPGRDRAAAAEAARALVAAGTTRPVVRLFVHETTDGGTGLVGFSIPHAWGDAVTVLGISRSLVSGPDPDGRLWTHVGSPVARPLLAALRHRFGSWAALRTVPAARRAGTADVAAATADPEVPVVDRADVVVLPVVLGREVVQALKAWRREHGRGASMNATVMAATRAALRAEGVTLTDGLVVAYDDRLYLPKASATRGNFVSAVRLRPADPQDPSSVHEAVQAAMTSGRPLLALAAGSATAALARRPAWPARPAPGGSPDLSFACVRMDRVLPPHLVAGPDGDTVLVCVTTPSAHASVAAMVLDMGTQIHVTLTAHTPVADRAALERALARLATDPVALLPQAGKPAGTAVTAAP